MELVDIFIEVIPVENKVYWVKPDDGGRDFSILRLRLDLQSKNNGLVLNECDFGDLSKRDMIWVDFRFKFAAVDLHSHTSRIL